MNLWKLLLAFLFLGVEGEGEGDDPPGEEGAAAGDDPPGDDDLDLGDGDDAGGGADAGASDAGDGKPPVKSDAETAAERRARLAEDALADERAARRAEQQRTATPPKDTDYEREEAAIAEARARGDTPEQLRWLQWQVDSNRNMRVNTRTSQAALAESRDIADKTEFGRLEITKPAVYKRYAERVEKAVQDMRANGQTASRSVILKLMIGDDIMSGKVKPKAGVKAKSADTSTVDRGRGQTVRSDVSGRQRSNEREKLRARLNGKLI